MKDDFSLEEQLVLDGVREVDEPDKHSDSIKSFVDLGIDWERFLKIANSAGVIPFIFFNLKKQNLLVHFPPSLVNILKKSYLLSLQRNLIIKNFMGEFLRNLCLKTEVIVLKGPALIETVYEDAGLRSFSDADILIKRQDLPSVHRLLTKDWKFQAAKGGKIHSCIDYYTSKSNGILSIISIRWELIRFERHNFAMGWDTQIVWDRSILVNICGQPVKMLCPEDAILYYCYHLGFHHLFGGLIWYVDLMKVVKVYGEKLDWQDIIEKAGKYGIRKVLHGVLSVTQKELGAKIPLRVLKQLNRNSAPKFAINKKVPRFKDLFLQLFLFDGLKQILKAVFRIIFPSREFLYLNFSKDKLEDKIADIRKFSNRPIYLYLGYLRRLSGKTVNFRPQSGQCRNFHRGKIDKHPKHLAAPVI